MTRPIAILGYGSLIWDLDDLAPKVTGGWQMAAGPSFPIEFSLVSTKRIGALALVIDPEHGAPCPSHSIASIRKNVPDAVIDLAARERTMLDRIGWADAESFGNCHPETGERIRVWCRETETHGAVWTDGRSNFAERVGAPFSIERAITYLKTLTGDSLIEAHRYITEAPAETDTPLRRALSQDGWWRAL